jgi:hypothetical protein
MQFQCNSLSPGSESTSPNHPLIFLGLPILEGVYKHSLLTLVCRDLPVEHGGRWPAVSIEVPVDRHKEGCLLQYELSIGLMPEVCCVSSQPHYK